MEARKKENPYSKSFKLKIIDNLTIIDYFYSQNKSISITLSKCINIGFFQINNYIKVGNMRKLYFPKTLLGFYYSIVNYNNRKPIETENIIVFKILFCNFRYCNKEVFSWMMPWQNEFRTFPIISLI